MPVLAVIQTFIGNCNGMFHWSVKMQGHFDWSGVEVR